MYDSPAQINKQTNKQSNEQKKSWPEKSQIGKSHFCTLFGEKKIEKKEINNNNNNAQKPKFLYLLLKLLI